LSFFELQLIIYHFLVHANHSLLLLCFQVSKLGYGCMGLSGVYNDVVPEDVATSLIKHAFSKGITFFDTSDFYGPHANEVLVGKVLLLL
jgi:aryl-alcohol dehydrogenase-like predicted oxidoreductase